MPKVKERNSDEWYRSKIRELEKQNRQLRKRIKELEKYDKSIDITHEILKEHEEQIKKLAELESTNYRELCPDCYKGKMQFKLSIRKKDYYECDTCHHKINKPSKEE